MEITVVNDLAPGAFALELAYQGTIVQIGFWEDGEIIAEDIAANHRITTPSAESWKKLRLIAGRAAKAVEEGES